MIFQPYYNFRTGCAAYLFGCAGLGRCAVVDPHLEDVDSYLAFAREKGMTITQVIDTHVHADHLSGGPELAKRAGAPYRLHRSADVRYPFSPVHDDEEIELGNTRIRVLHTPGHTPESISLIVTDLRRAAAPWFILTGDTLFSGGVGRPDLPGHERENASILFDSLHEKLLTLPETLEVYPAHFAGSACGAGLSGKPSTTLAFEKANNPLLGLPREAFIDTLCVPLSKPPGMAAFLARNRGEVDFDEASGCAS